MSNCMWCQIFLHVKLSHIVSSSELKPWRGLPGSLRGGTKVHRPPSPPHRIQVHHQHHLHQPRQYNLQHQHQHGNATHRGWIKNVPLMWKAPHYVMIIITLSLFSDSWATRQYLRSRERNSCAQTIANFSMWRPTKRCLHIITIKIICCPDRNSGKCCLTFSPSYISPRPP